MVLGWNTGTSACKASLQILFPYRVTYLFAALADAHAHLPGCVASSWSGNALQHPSVCVCQWWITITTSQSRLSPSDPVPGWSELGLRSISGSCFRNDLCTSFWLGQPTYSSTTIPIAHTCACPAPLQSENFDEAVKAAFQVWTAYAVRESTSYPVVDPGR